MSIRIEVDKNKPFCQNVSFTYLSYANILSTISNALLTTQRTLAQAVPTNEARRAIFERYVRTRADEERKEKKAALRAAIEGFKQLLEEASEVGSQF